MNKNRIFILITCCIILSLLASCKPNSPKKTAPTIKSTPTSGVTIKQSPPPSTKPIPVDNTVTPQINTATLQRVIATKTAIPTNLPVTPPVNENFKELKLEEIPDDLISQIGIEAVKYYKCGDIMYLLTYSGKKTPERTKSLQNVRDGGCSEVWTYDIKTYKLHKLFVMYGSTSTGHTSGAIWTINKVDIYGNIYFEETLAVGMQHYDEYFYKYIPKDNKIVGIGYQGGRGEYTPDIDKKVSSWVISKDVLDLYYKLSDIVDSNGFTTYGDWFDNSGIYTTKYNLQDEKAGKHYHEIGKFSLDSGIYTPLLRKVLSQEDPSPSISICGTNSKSIVEIYDYCWFSKPPSESDKKFYYQQIYTYDLQKNTITKKQGTEETGKYEIVLIQ